MKATLRMAAMLVSALFSLSACGTVPAHASVSLKKAGASQPIRAVVEGSALGYTNQDLTRVVSSCLAHMPLQGDAAKGQWIARFSFDTSFMGAHPVEDMRATLLKKGTAIASRWTRTVSPDDETRNAFCGVVAGVVHELLLPEMKADRTTADLQGQL